MLPGVRCDRAASSTGELAHEALPLGLCQHVALPLAGELAAGEEHGRLLSVRGLAG
jgi:hypothetical protein